MTTGNPSRRQFGALLAASLLRAGRARAQSAHAPSQLFDIQRLAPGAYAAISRPAAIINCNAMIFENQRDLLIVDSHSKPSASASLVAQIRREISPKPVRYIVNTHFHWDHVQGMPTYAKLAPGADVIASESTRQTIEEQALKRLATSLEGSRTKLERSREALGSAQGDAEKRFHQRMINELQTYLAEMKDWTPELPNITFDRELIVHDRAQDLHMVFKGRAHTGGDISVFCPQKKVIATADVLSSFIPGMYDGYPLEWSATLRRIGELEFERVVPGHGDVQDSKRRLGQVISYIDEIIETVSKGRQEGKSKGELQKSITLDRLRTISQSDYGAFVEASLAKHTLIAPGAHARDSMENSLRTNIANIFDAFDSSAPKAGSHSSGHKKEGFHEATLPVRLPAVDLYGHRSG
jgi:cyclase